MRVGEEIFLQHIKNAGVYDPIGDRLGTVIDVVLLQREKGIQAVGFVVGVARKRSVFLPLNRVKAVHKAQVIMTGLLNMQRFSKRDFEQLAFRDFLGKKVKVKSADDDNKSVASELADLSIRLGASGQWMVNKAFIKEDHRNKTLFRIPKHRNARIVPLKHVTFLSKPKMSMANKLVAEFVDRRPADIAEEILDLPMKQRLEVVKSLEVKQLAPVLEEMPEDEQIKILAHFDQEQQADIIQAIQPDDAADLLSELSTQQREDILEKMTPEEAEDVRQLLEYDPDSAGGLMTTLPVILSGQTDVATALAEIRKPELPPALASMVFVCRPPMETPTGVFEGAVHFQALLRVPPTTKLHEILDQDVPSLPADAKIDRITRELATYDSLTLPILDSRKRLLGAVSIDDVLDHSLPENWREVDDD